ncbi:MAG: aminotransferase class III-fold pyridoxal phosphate-dependent enzyme, partial [Candidatus Sungbacteria bacterium]|nr:aminotransferase class III-fold pyridoxal phosphate-dependent enzyme [Candidatus Sungbacteria bacterium]
METKFFESSDDFSQKYYTERHENLIAPSTLDSNLNLVIAKTKGTRVWDESGKEYIDFNASVGTSGIGHCHPKMLEMLRKQLEVIDFIEATGFNHRIRELKVAGKSYEISLAALAETLLPLMFPDTSLSLLRMAPEVTGAQAVNTAVKLLLKANPGKYHFLGFKSAFHGRHGFSLDFTNSKPIQKQDYPSSGIVVHYLPFPDSYENLEEAKAMLSNIPLETVNAFLGEYLQGVGGFKWPSVSYMDELLGTLRSLGIRIAIDEIQSGLGRTGKWFAWQHGTVTPDVVIAGKALGGGAVPMSAVGYYREIFDFNDAKILKSGWHSGTFPGYITAVAVGIMFLDIMKEEKVLENVMLRSA